MPPVAGLHVSIGAHPFKFVPILVESRCPIMENGLPRIPQRIAYGDDILIVRSRSLIK